MKITIRNFQKKTPVYPTRIKRAILKVLSCEGKELAGEITVCFVNSKKITQLNSKFHRKSIPTDVLSFDISDKSNAKTLIADVIICVDVAKENAKIYQTTTAFELKLYAIHGVLHLLGYGDHTLKQKKQMRSKESIYVNR